MFSPTTPASPRSIEKAETVEERVSRFQLELQTTELEIKEAEHELLKDLATLQATQTAFENTVDRGVDAIGEAALAFGNSFKHIVKKGSHKAGEAEALCQSSNTIGWLEDHIKRSNPEYVYHKATEADVKPWMAWALEFDLPAYDASMVKAGQNEGKEYDRRDTPIAHQTWTIVEQLAACELFLDFEVSFDGSKIILLVGAPYETLANEAHFTRIKLRMQETKGQLKFDKGLTHFYACNHGGLNEFGERGWTRRDPSRAVGWSAGENADEDAGVRQLRYENVFASAVKQRLVYSRMKRVGNVDMDQVVNCPTPDTTIKTVAGLVTRRKAVPCRKIYEMLLSVGAFRPNAANVFPKMQGQAAVAELGDFCLEDPNFVISPQGLASSKITGDKQPTYELVNMVVKILTSWRSKSGPGRQEEFVGQLNAFFPLHDDAELAYLMSQWGNFGCLFKPNIVGYNPEAEPALIDRGPPKMEEANTFGSDLNIPHEHAIPWSWLYQPIDEIRDYFGDDVALYFSWIGMYTSALFLLAFFGIGVMALQPVYGGVDNNPMTLMYSTYMGMWSILFLSAWTRRESELRFLWGTEQLLEDDHPRLAFVGVLRINFETGRQKVVPASAWVQTGKRLAGFGVVLLMMLLTITSATLAMVLRYYGQTEGDGTCTTESIVETMQAVRDESNDNIADSISHLDKQILQLQECDHTPETHGRYLHVESVFNVTKYALNNLSGILNSGYVEPESPDGSYDGSESWQEDEEDEDFLGFGKILDQIKAQKYQILSSVANLLIIVVFGNVFEMVAVKLNDWENYRTDAEYENGIVLKNFAFQFVNNVSVCPLT